MRINVYTYHLLYKKILTFALMIIVFWACSKDNEPITPGTTFTRLLANEVIKSKILKREINYAVLLPKNYGKTSDSFPVVYLLHGYGDNQSAWHKYGLIQYYSDLDVAQNGPMIFVMPQAFNTYYVNKYNGIYPYMDFFTTELVPTIDSVYRTKKDKTQRAVMGFSMGGYGALILPAVHPELFSISVPLSMSFRTDEQYMAESQTAFDNQWASVFGGYGTEGINRLTDYFKEHSPFHFFNQNDLSKFATLRILLDCGDDEESLSVTNGALHNLLKNRSIPHEFRVRNGGHSWDYWHKSLPEALAFISHGFQNLNYPENQEPVTVENQILPEQYQLEDLNGSNIQLGIFKPADYDLNTSLYPGIFLLHGYKGGTRSENAKQILSLLNDKMQTGKLPNSLIIEIPVSENEITAEIFTSVLNQIKTNYHLMDDNKGLVLMGNENGGTTACSLIDEFPDTFNGCFLFDANLTPDATPTANQYYYVDASDKTNNPAGNYNFYLTLRNNGNDHEYRIHQGTPSLQSTLNGINESINYLSKKLRNS